MPCRRWRRHHRVPLGGCCNTLWRAESSASREAFPKVKRTHFWAALGAREFLLAVASGGRGASIFAFCLSTRPFPCRTPTSGAAVVTANISLRPEPSIPVHMSVPVCFLPRCGLSRASTCTAATSFSFHDVPLRSGCRRHTSSPRPPPFPHRLFTNSELCLRLLTHAHTCVHSCSASVRVPTTTPTRTTTKEGSVRAVFITLLVFFFPY